MRFEIVSWGLTLWASTIFEAWVGGMLFFTQITLIDVRSPEYR